MLHEKLKSLREERGLTQQEVGDAIGVSRVAISGYENGEKKPKKENLKKLAEYFGVPIQYLDLRTQTPEWLKKQIISDSVDDMVKGKAFVNFEDVFYHAIEKYNLTIDGRTVEKDDLDIMIASLKALREVRDTDVSE